MDSDHIKSLINSPLLYEAIEKVGLAFGLDIDQIGDLGLEVQNIILGLSKPADFTTNIVTSMGLSQEKARAITASINTEVLTKFTELSDAGVRDDHITAVEEAGGFEIERTDTTSVPIRKPFNLINEVTPGSVESKGDIMAEIENPQAASPRKEPLVEQLLRGVTAVPEQKVVREASTGTDPYREAI